MKKGIRNARIVQLVGALCLVVMVVKCAGGALTDEPGAVGLFALLGLVLVIGARVYEFLNRE